MGTSLFFFFWRGSTIQPTTPSFKEKKYARTPASSSSCLTSDAAGLQRDPSGKREGGSRWFYLVCCDVYLPLAAFPFAFNKVHFEGSSPSWLCCKEPGSWTRVQILSLPALRWKPADIVCRKGGRTLGKFQIDVISSGKPLEGKAGPEPPLGGQNS